MLDGGILATPYQIRTNASLEANDFLAASTPEGTPTAHRELCTWMDFSIWRYHGEVCQIELVQAGGVIGREPLGSLGGSDSGCLAAGVSVDSSLAKWTADLFVAGEVVVLDAVPLASDVDVADDLLVPDLGLKLDSLTAVRAINRGTCLDVADDSSAVHLVFLPFGLHGCSHGAYQLSVSGKADNAYYTLFYR